MANAPREDGGARRSCRVMGRSIARGAPCLDAKNDGGEMESRRRVPVRQERRHGWPRLKHRQSQNRKNDERNRESHRQRLSGVRAFAVCGHIRQVRDIDAAARRGSGDWASITRRSVGLTLAAPGIGLAGFGLVLVAAPEGRQLGADPAIGVGAAKPWSKHSRRQELQHHEEGDEDG